ncbi:hypothetical protein OKW46_001368 [Paraburkholderia sp. WSM4179]|nr:hypothetical protein [Paraburkholderia sp. WSM4179]
MQLVAPQVLDRGGVGPAPEKSGELTDHADITGLRLRCELAHAHVVDQALAQRTDILAGVSHGSAPVEERGGLPRTQHGNRAGFLSPATRAQSEPHYRASGFVLRGATVIRASTAAGTLTAFAYGRGSQRSCLTALSGGVCEPENCREMGHADGTRMKSDGGAEGHEPGAPLQRTSAARFGPALATAPKPRRWCARPDPFDGTARVTCRSSPRPSTQSRWRRGRRSVS